MAQSYPTVTTKPNNQPVSDNPPYDEVIYKGP